MSDEFSDIYDTEDDETSETPGQNGPKALREALKREKEKREEAERREAALRSEVRESKLVEALNGAGLHPKVAKLVPADVGPDKLNDWIAEYGEAFGVQKQEEVVTPVPQAAADLAAVSGSPGGAPAGTPSSPEDIQAKLDTFTNKDDLMKFLRANRTVHE